MTEERREYCINCTTYITFHDRESFERRHGAQCPRHPRGGHSACQCGDNKPDAHAGS